LIKPAQADNPSGVSIMDPRATRSIADDPTFAPVIQEFWSSPNFVAYATEFGAGQSRRTAGFGRCFAMRRRASLPGKRKDISGHSCRRADSQAGRNRTEFAGVSSAPVFSRDRDSSGIAQHGASRHY
jgi:hypothetical protein